MSRLGPNVRKLATVRVIRRSGGRTFEELVDTIRDPGGLSDAMQRALAWVRWIIETERKRRIAANDEGDASSNDDEAIAGYLLKKLGESPAMKRSNASGYDTHSFAVATGRIKKHG